MGKTRYIFKSLSYQLDQNMSWNEPLRSLWKSSRISKKQENDPILLWVSVWKDILLIFLVPLKWVLKGIKWKLKNYSFSWNQNIIKTVIVTATQMAAKKVSLHMYIYVKIHLWYCERLYIWFFFIFQEAQVAFLAVAMAMVDGIITRSSKTLFKFQNGICVQNIFIVIHHYCHTKTYLELLQLPMHTDYINMKEYKMFHCSIKSKKWRKSQSE